MTMPPCNYRGAIYGAIRPTGCNRVSATVYACLSEYVPSGLCVDSLNVDKVIEAPLFRADPANRPAMRTSSRVVFPYTLAMREQGHLPHDDWILRCDHCPHRSDPPEEVCDLYRQRDELQARIQEYESAETLEAREAFIRPVR